MFVPTPSEMFTEAGTSAKRRLDGKQLEAFGVFKKVTKR
jgi:hypothetical protein